MSFISRLLGAAAKVVLFLRQIRIAHEKPVALPRRFTSLVDRSDDQALAVAAVIGAWPSFLDYSV